MSEAERKKHFVTSAWHGGVAMFYLLYGEGEAFHAQLGPTQWRSDRNHGETDRCRNQSQEYVCLSMSLACLLSSLPDSSYAK